MLCPLIATYVTNTYRVPARLFVVGGSELKSAEGTTQGDPLAMSMYAISLQPLISLLHNRSTAKQLWFADDATGAGPLEEVKQFPTPETMGNLGANLTRKVLGDCLGGHARHLKWR